MSMQQSELQLNCIYPTPVIRGTRISRMEETRLGEFQLDAPTAEFLGTERIGVFVGGIRRLKYLVHGLRQLDVCGTGGKWLVVFSTRKMAAAFYQRWLDDSNVYFVGPDEVPSCWTSQRLHFAVPEHLSTATQTLLDSGDDVAGIILLDPFCIVHEPHRNHRGKRVARERSHFISKCCQRLRRGAWIPPLLFLSRKPAKSVTTNALLGAYGLETIQFLAGDNLRLGAPPQEWYALHGLAAESRNFAVHTPAECSPLQAC